MLGNVLLYLAVVLGPSLLLGLGIWATRLARAHLDRRRAPTPRNVPIERLSADLRRVHRYLIDLPEDAPALRRNAAEQAYDALLVSACQALDVDHELAGAAARIDRELERLRVEEALRAAGLRIP
ncbi:MAG: hypothetical protein ACRDQF_08600 [Thermocrispum sp.]